MIYQLILQPEAQHHLKEWQKSGQVKVLKKIASLLKNYKNIQQQGLDKLNSLKEIYPVFGVSESIKVHA